MTDPGIEARRARISAVATFFLFAVISALGVPSGFAQESKPAAPRKRYRVVTDQELEALQAAERDEQEHLLDTYLRALGMAPDMEEAA